MQSVGGLTKSLRCALMTTVAAPAFFRKEMKARRQRNVLRRAEGIVPMLGNGEREHRLENAQKRVANRKEQQQEHAAATATARKKERTCMRSADARVEQDAQERLRKAAAIFKSTSGPTRSCSERPRRQPLNASQHAACSGSTAGIGVKIQRSLRQRAHGQCEVSCEPSEIVPSSVGALALHTIVPATLPPRPYIDCAATCNVLCASVKHGIAYWGSDSGKFCCPAAWDEIIQWIYREFTTRSLKEQSDARADMHFVHGEYNLAACLSEHAARTTIEVPDLDFSNCIIRVTRPDYTVGKDGTPLYRFTSRRLLQSEFYHTLHAAANGFGVACQAAFLFPALRQGARQLYGAMFVLDKAPRDTNALLDVECAVRHNAVAAEGRKTCNVGKKIAAPTVAMLYHMSLMGGVSADTKPGNVVFDGKGTAFAIDYDSNMYALLKESSGGWPVNMLHNLVLFTAHVRCYRPACVAASWISAVAPLLLDLCTYVPADTWLLRAQTRSFTYKECVADLETASVQRFEFIVHAYFMRGKHARFVPNTQLRAPPLIEQLVQFCLQASAAPISNEEVALAFKEGLLRACRDT